MDVGIEIERAKNFWEINIKQKEKNKTLEELYSNLPVASDLESNFSTKTTFFFSIKQLSDQDNAMNYK